MKKIAILMLVLLTGCTSAIQLPGTRNPDVEKIRLLTEAISKQSDAIIAIATKSTPTPTPTPEPTPEDVMREESHYGEEPILVIASKRIK